MASKKQQTLSNFFQKPATTAASNLRHKSASDEVTSPAAKRRRLDSSPNSPALDTVRSIDATPDESNYLQPLSSSSQNVRTHSTKPELSQRTSEYLFTSSQLPNEDAVKQPLQDTHREELHRKFVKKLGRPDSFNDIKRRNRALVDDDEDQSAGEDEDAADAEPEPPTKGRARVKKQGNKLTPMERQVIDIKKAHPDALLVIEVGYKFRFFGEDARYAARELGIVCIPGKLRFDEHESEAHLDRFASASIPVHRLHVHVKRLVAAGYKVGVVRQLETAALKAVGDNRNAPFVRKLTNLYTKGTYVDEIDGIDDSTAAANQPQPTGFLLCITETNAKGYGNDEKVDVGIVAVQPATGEIVYDNFEDGFMRSEIETRLLHIAPVEFLIMGNLSRASDKLVEHLSGTRANVFADKARVERKEKSKTAAAEAYDFVSKFYREKLKPDDQAGSKTLEKILSLSEHVTICLAALITHLSDYGLDNVFDLTKYFQPFSARSHMLINGNTLSSLEIYQNQTDFTMYGSLFWALDRTKTKFGSRMLRKWVGRPLLNPKDIEARQEAVQEMLDPDKSVQIEKLKQVLAKMRIDLEKSLLRVYYGKCTRPELLNLLQAFQYLTQQYADVTARSSGFASPLLTQAISDLPTIQSEVTGLLDRINLGAAKSDDKYAFFREEYETDEISEHKFGIASVEDDLNTFRTTAGEKIGRKRPVDYATVAGIDYLIEVENDGAAIKKVPASWAKISGTKKLSRFHPPEVVKLVRERDQHKEALAAACDTAFSNLLAEVSLDYQKFRDAIVSLATLDCLLSLATIAQQPGYSRPEFVENTQIELRGVRHPMIEQLLVDSYVANDVTLTQDSTRALLVTGPNMGGKSSYVRSVALVVIMAQIGSFVPAESARLSITDAVFTRMGAFDNMTAGESTFMVELSETSDILKLATNRSLVILDELGRGTSTHDGVAIAGGVLDWLVREKMCFTLFITHYQILARMADAFNGELKNVHMMFSEDVKGGDDVTFLYEVGEGVAHRSYGLNVAKLAGLDPGVIDLAKEKSTELETVMRQRRLQGLSKVLGGQGAEISPDTLDALVEAIELL